LETPIFDDLHAQRSRIDEKIQVAEMAGASSARLVELLKQQLNNLFKKAVASEQQVEA
jgi:hypothetical protein